MVGRQPSDFEDGVALPAEFISVTTHSVPMWMHPSIMRQPVKAGLPVRLIKCRLNGSSMMGSCWILGTSLQAMLSDPGYSGRTNTNQLNPKAV